jgi:uncharacterized protein with PIN domain
MRTPLVTCDACGKEVRGDMGQTWFYYTRCAGPNENIAYDVCPECDNKIRIVLNEHKRLLGAEASDQEHGRFVLCTNDTQPK